MSHKIAIAYRIYPGISKTPAFFSHDKLIMAEVCFASFIHALEGVEFHLWVLFDNCPPEYEAMCLRHCSMESMTFVHYDGIGNARTFEQQILLLEQQQYSHTIMFAEDDYFYLRGTVVHALDCLHSNNDVDFVTLHNHPNYYSLPLHRHTYTYKSVGAHRWKKVNSTCLTFITTQDQLAFVKKVFLTYKKNNYDASMWLAITKIGVWSLPFLVAAIKDPMHKRIFAKVFIFTSFHYFFKPAKQLWAPEPSLNTHMEKKDLAPDIDWHFYVTSLAKEIGVVESK